MDKTEILEAAGEYVFDVLTDKIFPAWYGTSWDFNGITTTPRQGSIACGYFVTTTLEDAGFNLDRSRLARQPSEFILKNLVGEDQSLKRFSNKELEAVTDEIQDQGNGLYLVGLDSHIGFIVNNEKGVNFVHSSYYSPPLQVVSEEADSFNPLKHSKYRVLTKLLQKPMMKKWIQGDKIHTKHDFFKG